MNRSQAEAVAALILKRRVSLDIECPVTRDGEGFAAIWTNVHTHEEVVITTVEQWDQIRRCIWYLDPSLDGK